jgi:thiaminase/transcriptional activator TenA
MTVTQDAWHAASRVIDRTHDLAFLEELRTGELAAHVFEYYIIQDAIYLPVYGESLTNLADRLGDHAAEELFRRHARESVEMERALHEAYTKAMADDLRRVDPTPACQAYCAYLRAAVNGPSDAAALGAVLACDWVYYEVGKQLMEQAKLDDHPYRAWIEAYGDPTYGNYVQETIDTCDRLGQMCTDQERRTLISAFTLATELEYAFWRDAYDLAPL